MGNPQYRKQIITRMRQAILEHDASYRQIALNAGVSPSVVYRLMTQESRVPSVETLGKLCDSLGVSADKILGITKE